MSVLNYISLLLAISHIYIHESKVKSSSLAYNRLKTRASGRSVGTRTGAGVTSTLVHAFIFVAITYKTNYKLKLGKYYC